METIESPAEGSALLRNVSWETYERLIAEREERRVPRFHYDRGMMEVMSPPKRHETISRIAALLIEMLVVEMDVEAVGSTTVKREDLARGFEPDESSYFSGNIELVRGNENINPDAGDPPPDLVIEVDITNPSLDKLGIYARLGVALRQWGSGDPRSSRRKLRGRRREPRLPSSGPRRARSLRRAGIGDEAPRLGAGSARVGFAGSG